MHSFVNNIIILTLEPCSITNKIGTNSNELVPIFLPTMKSYLYNQLISSCYLILQLEK